VNTYFALFAEQLDRQGLAIVDNLLPTEVAKQLLVETISQFNQGEFHPALIGRGVSEQRISEVRGDNILWLEESTLSESQRIYFNLLGRLREHLSDYFRIGLPWAEIHLAAYPKASFYARHLDQFKETNNRIFSAILYLNEGWTESDGGQLRIYNEDGSHFDIEPKMNRFVCFRSDLVEHEVLHTNRTRFSVTGWIRRDRPTPIFV